MYGWSTLCRRAWRTRSTQSTHPCILSGFSFRMNTRALLWRQDILDDRIGSLQKEIDEADRNIVEAMSSRKDEFAAALRRIRTFSTNFDVRKMAAVTKHDTHNFTSCADG